MRKQAKKYFLNTVTLAGTVLVLSIACLNTPAYGEPAEPKFEPRPPVPGDPGSSVEDTESQDTEAVELPDASALFPLPTAPANRFDAAIEEGYIALNIQKTADLPLDLEILMGLVATENIDIAIAQARIDQAKGDMMVAWSEVLPSVRGSMSLEKYNGGQIFIDEQPVEVNRRTFFPRLDLEYTIQTGGKALYMIKAAKSNLQKNLHTKDRFYQNALLKSLSLYFTYLRDSSTVLASRVSLEEAEKEQHLATIRRKYGFSTDLEVTQSQAAKAQSREQLLQAISQKEATRTQLTTLLNLPPTLEITPAQKQITPLSFIDPAKTLDDHVASAMVNRPDLKELSYMAKESAANYKASRADLFPTLRLGTYIGGVGPSLNDLRKVNQVGSQVYVDVLKNMGVGTLGQMKKAKARQAEVELQKEQQLTNAKQAIADTYYQINLYRQKLDASQANVTAARQAHLLAEVQLKGGIGTTFDLMKKHVELNEAELAYLTTVMEYNNSQIKLLYETGQLTPENVLVGRVIALADESAPVPQHHQQVQTALNKPDITSLDRHTHKAEDKNPNNYIEVTFQQ
ncbi:MAG: TolC family protein [Vampirovibrio sp.]|nr:TolC family protein [Vampirovibrio sp.]